jgi:hypothetical protein
MSWRERFPYATVPWVAAYVAGALTWVVIGAVLGWVGVVSLAAAGALGFAGVVWKVDDEAGR